MGDMLRKNISIFVGLFLSFIISDVIVAIVDTVCTKILLLRSVIHSHCNVLPYDLS